MTFTNALKRPTASPQTKPSRNMQLRSGLRVALLAPLPQSVPFRQLVRERAVPLLSESTLLPNAATAAHRVEARVAPRVGPPPVLPSGGQTNAPVFDAGGADTHQPLVEPNTQRVSTVNITKQTHTVRKTAES